MDDTKKKIGLIAVIVIALAVVGYSITRMGGAATNPPMTPYAKTPPPDSADAGETK
jgi:hypothetical protein